jgi:hypothetical protein
MDSSNNKTTDDLIRELSAKHAPVKRDTSPFFKFLISLYSIFIVCSLTMYIKSPFYMKIINGFHLAEVISIFLVINSTCFLAFKSMVPGENKKNAFWFLCTSIFIFLTVLALRFFYFEPSTQSRAFCDFEGIGISFVITVIAHFLTRKNEFFSQQVFSHLLFIGLPLVVTFFMHTTCSVSFIHMILYHVISPLIIPVTYLWVRVRKASHSE